MLSCVWTGLPLYFMAPYMFSPTRKRLQYELNNFVSNSSKTKSYELCHLYWFNISILYDSNYLTCGYFYFSKGILRETSEKKLPPKCIKSIISLMSLLSYERRYFESGRFILVYIALRGKSELLFSKSEWKRSLNSPSLRRSLGNSHLLLS